MTKRILVFNGHPAEASLARHLAEAYVEGATASGFQLQCSHLNDLRFDPDFERAGYRDIKPPEPDLETLLSQLEWAEHIVLITPMWWGGLPARLKGALDRMLLPGRSFDTRQKRFGMPKPLMTGRSARVIVTSDTPDWFQRLAYRSGLQNQLRRQVFGFVGIRPVRFSHFSPATEAKPSLVASWTDKVRELGRAGA